MAPTDQNVPLWPRVELTWTTPFSGTLWQRLSVGKEIPQEILSRVAQDTEQPPSDPKSAQLGFKAARLFYALPTDRSIDPRYARLYAFQRSDNEIFWYLSLMMAPDSSPPESIATGDLQIGGLIGLTKLLNEVFAEHAPIGTFVVRFSFDAAGWSCKALELDIAAIYSNEISRFGSALKYEQVSFNVTNGADGVEVITIGHDSEDKEFWCQIDIKSQVSPVQQPWFSSINDLCNEVQKYFFAHQEAR
jgi:hypothetical protein